MGKQHEQTSKDIQHQQSRDQSEIILRYHYILIRMSKLKSNYTKHWQWHRETVPFLHSWWHTKMVQPLCEKVWQVLTTKHAITINWETAHLWFIQRNEKLCSHKALQINAHSSFTGNSQKLQITQTPSNGPMANTPQQSCVMEYSSATKRNEPSMNTQLSWLPRGLC